MKNGFLSDNRLVLCNCQLYYLIYMGNIGVDIVPYDQYGTVYKIRKITFTQEIRLYTR